MILQGRRIAILVEDLYQDQEVWYPYFRLKEAGAEVVVVGTTRREFKSKHGYPIRATATAEKLSASDFDGVVVPGGYAPDMLRRFPAVIRFVRAMDRQGKVIAAICHAGWVLCSADVLRGRTVTCFSAIKDDLINAGATYVDREVVRDGHLITARKPDDLPAFMRTMIETLAAASTTAVRANPTRKTAGWSPAHKSAAPTRSPTKRGRHPALG